MLSPSLLKAFTVTWYFNKTLSSTPIPNDRQDLWASNTFKRLEMDQLGLSKTRAHLQLGAALGRVDVENGARRINGDQLVEEGGVRVLLVNSLRRHHGLRWEVVGILGRTIVRRWQGRLAVTVDPLVAHEYVAFRDLRWSLSKTD